MTAAIGFLITASAPACDPIDGGIPDRVSCRECSITVETVATIGDTTATRMLSGRPTDVWVDGRGRYWINVLDALPMLYDPARAELADIARQGEGPGELRLAWISAALPGDSMLVGEGFQYRVFAPDVTIARTIRSSHMLGALTVLRWPDNVLASSSPYDRATRTVRTVIGRYAMSLDTVAAIDTVLVTTPSPGRGAEWANGFRVFGTPSADGDIWISNYNAYHLVRYSAAGVPQDSLRRTLPWFPAGQPMRLGGPEEPASPHMIGNWVDGDGRLWTLVAEPRQDAAAAWEGVGSLEGMREVRVAALPADYELKRTLIEVIDPAARRVVTRHTVDGYIIAVLPDNHVASFVETSEGVPILTIHRLTLRQAPP